MGASKPVIEQIGDQTTTNQTAQLLLWINWSMAKESRESKWTFKLKAEIKSTEAISTKIT